MYKPKFCAECGLPVSQGRWLLWTSRRFCGACTGRFRKAELGLPLMLGMALLTAGFTLGRYLRPAPPALIVQRAATSPLPDTPLGIVSTVRARPASNGGAAGESSAGGSQTQTSEEIIYTCGARTKKGTPCARRVHGPVRCWQHKGVPAILSQEKLLIKD